MTGGIRILSGGQTGVDRAALDSAMAAGLPAGGTCPLGRLAEDGPIPVHYPLAEAESPDPAVRTYANVHAAEATLIVVDDPEPAGWGPGTRLTVQYAHDLGRPCFVAALGAAGTTPATVVAWTRAAGIGPLNVAGPRESEAPGIGGRARTFLDAVFAALAAQPRGPTF